MGSHTLTFSQLQGQFTVDKDLIGKQDPYVVFQSGSAKVQTKALKSAGTTAEWRESYSLEQFSPSSGTTLEATVYNHNTLLPDAVIGSGTVDLSRLEGSSLSGSGGPTQVRLVDKKGKDVGTLSFVIHGGGYSGRGASSGTGVGTGTTGTGTGHHTGSGVGTGASAAGVAGAAAGAAHHHGHHGQHGTQGGNVVGAGAGTDRQTAQVASDTAAAQGRSVAVEGERGVGVGHPVSHGTTGTGVTSGTTGSRGVTSGTTGGVGYGTKEGEVIDRKYYTGTENRPQDQALVEQYREHNPYAKDYETTVQHTGRERLVGSQIEALGTRERVIGQDHHVHAHPHQEIQKNLPAGAIADRPGGEGWVQGKAGPVCDTTQFSVSGDRTVDKERVTDLKEHREFEKEFEVKTRLVGERALNTPTEAEILNRERVLVDEKNKNACEGHPEVGTGVGTGTGSRTGTGAGYGTGTGVGTGTGAGYGTGTGTGAGYGTGTGTGAGYGTGSGTGQRSTAGEKAAGFIPGSEENRDKKEGLNPGSGANQTAGRPTAGEKAASFIPGSDENREKKAERTY